jgi:hypothetical protein
MAVLFEQIAWSKDSEDSSQLLIIVPYFLSQLIDYYLPLLFSNIITQLITEKSK